MKYAVVIFLALLLTGLIFLFTKPSDTRLREAAMKIVGNNLVRVPGYSDPNSNNSLPPFAEADKVIIKDKLLWKEVSYVYPSTVVNLGVGYLGTFHAAGTKANGKP